MYKKNRLYLFFAAMLLMAFGGYAPAIAMKDNTFLNEDKQSGLWTLEAVQKAIDDLEKQIVQAQQGVNDETARQLGVSVSDLNTRNAKLALTKTAYLEIMTHLGKKDDLINRKNLAQEQIQAYEQRGMIRKPPYSLSYYDILLREAATVDQVLETTANSIDAGKRSLADLRLSLENILKEIRLQKERLANISQGPEHAAAAWRMTVLETDRGLYRPLVDSERLKVENLSIEYEIAQLKAQLYQQQVAWVRANLFFDPSDLRQQLDALEKKQAELLGDLEKRIEKKNQADETYRKAFADSQKGVQVENPSIAQTTLETKALWRSTYQASIEQIQEILRLTAYQRQVWQNRYDLLKGELDVDIIDQWSDDTSQHLKKLTRMVAAEQNLQSGLMQQIDTTEKQLVNAELKPHERRQYGEQLRALQQQIRNRLDYMSDLTSIQLLDRRFLDELALKRGRAPLMVNISQTVGKLGNVWEYELWVIDDNAVTVRKVIFAVIILFAGLIITKYLIKKFGRVLLARSQLKKTTAAAIEKLFAYAAYVMVLLLALRVVNIPLAAFAFLGGAVAIGIGFGAQNLINNFISGFIIMGEKPISINDLIEVDGIPGQVEEIGARCTRIRTGENIDILVPNSAFLEKNITNWTLTNTMIRAWVRVGVAYGSPVEEVETLLLKAAGRIDAIAGTPEPFVLFTDFGDNALTFEVYFWISVRKVIERRKIESSVRFSIDALFRQAGIVIAFPQRDLHLYADKAIPVRLHEDKERQ